MLKVTSPTISIGTTHGEPMTTCANTGCDNPPRPRSGNTGPLPKYCLEHDHRIPRAQQNIRCPTCKQLFAAKMRTHKYCSQHCGEVATGARRPQPLAQKQCELPECGVTFTPTHTWQRCCTSLHGHRLYNRESRADGRQKAQPWNDRRKDQYHRRRALKRAGTDAGNPVVFADIAARDHWKCGICHTKVNPRRTSPDQMSASLDHILPLNAGGQHDPSNVRLVHLLCNTRRSDRYNGDAVMLFS